MSLSKLNHDCFLAVLGNSSMSRKLALRQVCNNWCTTIESQLHRQKSLALFRYTHERTPSDMHIWGKYLPKVIFPNIAKHALFLKDFSSIYLVPSLLIRLFPSVEKLLFFLSAIEVEHTRDYLSALTTSLSSLAIPYCWTTEWSQLADCLSLKRLFINYSQSKDSPEFSKVMSRLEYFAANTLSLGALHHLGANIQWLQIDHLYCYQTQDYQNFTEALWHLPNQTRDRLEHLSIAQMVTVNEDYATEKMTILQSLLRTMPNLKSFYFFDNSIPLKVLASKIAVLQDLKELSVSASAFRKATEEGFDIHQCAQLSSVKIVCVEDQLDWRIN